MTRSRYWLILSALVLFVNSFPTVSAQQPSKDNSKPQTKIVGGAAVPISFAPWQVALLDLALTGGGDWHKQFCGGSLISEKFVLTAAHCLDGGISLRNLRVLSGQAMLNSSRLSNNLTAVKRIEIHNLYNPATLENDIALIELVRPLKLRSGSVELIKLPSTKPPSESLGRISGWGYALPTVGDSPGTPIPGQSAYPTELMGGAVSILSDANCFATIESSFDQISMLCAQGGTNNQGVVIDTCYGDSGGPLAVILSGSWFLAGITSWGIGCGWTTPGVYTNVSNYKFWVESRVSFKNSQTITFSPPTTLTLAQTPFTLTANSSSALTPVISSSSPLICTVSGLLLTLLSTGVCALTANQNGSDLFQVAPTVNRSISVLNTLVSQTLSFSPPASLLLDQSPFMLSAITSSGLTPIITTQTSRTCLIEGYILRLQRIGRCTLTATQAGNEGFAPANPVTVNITVRRR